MREPVFPPDRASGRASRWLGSLAFVLGTALPAAADPAAGEALFREGRRLFELGKIAEACDRFADSQALDASSGTLLNLADCHEEQGKTATAWAEFLAAAQLAQMQHKPQHETEATRRANALESRLSFLTIEVAEPRPGLRISKDGQVLPTGVLGTRIPVDPGERVIEASAPGYARVRLAITVGTSGDHKRALIPALEPEKDAPALQDAEPAPRAERTQGTSRATLDAEPRSPPPSVLPWVIGGAGVAAIGVGSVFGVMALAADSDAAEACEQRVGCSDAAMDAVDRRDRQALIANIGVGAGIAAVGVAAVLFLTQGEGAAPATASRRGADASALGANASLVRGGFTLHVARAF